MKFIKIRKPLKNLNEVLKHTEMPQKFYGNFFQKTETPQKKRKRLKKKRGNASTK